MQIVEPSNANKLPDRGACFVLRWADDDYLAGFFEA